MVHGFCEAVAHCCSTHKAKHHPPWGVGRAATWARSATQRYE